MRDEFIHLNRLDVNAFPPSLRWASVILALIVVAAIAVETASVVSA